MKVAESQIRDVIMCLSDRDFLTESQEDYAIDIASRIATDPELDDFFASKEVRDEERMEELLTNLDDMKDSFDQLNESLKSIAIAINSISQ